ncbi:MAG: DUF945 family protein [Halothiobacillaceae bacterium]
MPLSLKNLALPLWVGLLCCVLGIILPWQVGLYLQKNLARTLEGLTHNVHASAHVHNYQLGLWQSSANVSINSPLLREPMELHLDMQHGPWLGWMRTTPTAWGWFALQTPLPTQGGLSIFPAQHSVDAWLYSDIAGDLHLGLRQNNRPHDLGKIRLNTANSTDTAQCRGELRLPGIKWLAPQGDVLLADIALRADLWQKHDERQGSLSVEALRAAWLMPTQKTSNAQAKPPALAASFLIEQPRVNFQFGKSTQLNAAWVSAQSINIPMFKSAKTHDLGRMNTRMAWCDLDWSALWSSLESSTLADSQTNALNTLAFALGDGTLTLETLELTQPQGRLRLLGKLHSHAPVLNWKDLEMHLHAELDRHLLSHWLIETGRAASTDEVNQTLNQLQQHGWINTPTPDQIEATLDLWRGEMIVTTRRVPLQSMLQ